MIGRVTSRLRALFHSTPRPSGDRVADVAATLEQRVLEFVGNLRALPDIATRALVLAEDPDSKSADFVRLIEADPAIATTLLRVANSALFAGGAQTLKLQQAVTRLGMWQCKNLIVAIAMRGAMRKLGAAAPTQCETLWHHGYVTASLCGQINKAYRLGFQGEEFAAGLLHDLGRLVLALAHPESFERVGGLCFHEDPGLLARERAVIGIDHCALGGWFGSHSELPTELVRTIRCHHDAELLCNSNRLVALVAVADDAANHLQRGQAAETYEPETSTEVAALCAGWHPGRKEGATRAGHPGHDASGARSSLGAIEHLSTPGQRAITRNPEPATRRERGADILGVLCPIPSRDPDSLFFWLQRRRDATEWYREWSDLVSAQTDPANPPGRQRA